MSCGSVSTGVMSTSTTGTGNGKKGTHKKTREELNDLEKQRTKRINQHIVALRNLLEMSNISTKKDKFSVLKNTYDYIVKLRQDIAKLNRRPTTETSNAQAPLKDDDEGNICYESLFCDADTPMALASVDGKFIKCNTCFETLSGYTSRELSRMTIFNITIPEEMNQLFNVIGSMLSYSEHTARHFWKSCKFRDKIETCFVTLWLVRSQNEESNCFQIMMIPLESCDGALASSGPMQHDTSLVVPDKESVGKRSSVQGKKGGLQSRVIGARGLGKKGQRRDNSTDQELEGEESSRNDFPNNLSGNLAEAATSLLNAQFGDFDVPQEEDFYEDVFFSLINEEELDFNDQEGGFDV